MKAIGYTATFIGLMLFSVLFSGYVLSVLWAWFFVPVLGLPEISVAGAVGIALVVSYLTHQRQDSDSKKSATSVLVEGFALAVLKPSFALLIGWIVAMWV